MGLPERRTGMIDRDLAVFPGWQLGTQPQQKRIDRRDLLGAIARAERAPLGEPELDVLTWITQEWFDQGSSIDGRVRFTLYALGSDLYGARRAGWTPSGRYRELMREAIDNLHAVVVTLRSVNVLTGEHERTLRSKVHILEAVVDHEQVQLFRDAGAANAAAVGALRGDTVEVKVADWLVHQLLSGPVVLDWRTQRKLAGAAKRLWYELSARAGDFSATAFPGQQELVLPLTAEFYTAMNLQAARERDNRAALTSAAKRVVAADATYRTVDVVRAEDGYVLRVVRCDDSLDGVVEGSAVELER